MAQSLFDENDHNRIAADGKPAPGICLPKHQGCINPIDYCPTPGDLHLDCHFLVGGTIASTDKW